MYGVRVSLWGEFSCLYFQILQHAPVSRPIYLLLKQGSLLIEYFPKNLSLQADAQPSKSAIAVKGKI